MKLCLIILFTSSVANGQKILLKSHGTYIISAMCKEGIVVASDSRTVWYNDKKKIGCYTESNNKLFEFQNLVIAMAGSYSFLKSNLTFYGLLQKFKSVNTSNIPVDDFYSRFTTFCKSILPIQDFNDLIGNQFIISGYKGGRRQILFYNNSTIESLTDIGYKTNYTLNNSGPLYNKFSSLLLQNDLSETNLLIENLLLNIFKSRNKDTLATVGGQVTILNFDNYGRIIWVKGKQMNEYLSAKEELMAILSKKVKVYYVSKFDSVNANKAFRQYILTH